MRGLDHTLDRLKVQWLLGIRDSGWLDIHPVPTLAQRYPFAQQVMSDLKLLLGCPVQNDALAVSSLLPLERGGETISDNAHSSPIRPTVVWFRCTLRPTASDALRAALVEVGLLEIDQAATQVQVRLAYEGLDNGRRLRLKSVALHDRGGEELLHATRTAFRESWGTVWSHEASFFQPYPEEGSGLWLRVGFRTEAGLLPTMFVGGLDLDERFEDHLGGREYRQVGTIMHSVNESVRMLLSDVVDRPAARLPYGYRAVSMVDLRNALATLFNMDELCDLAFDLGIDCENLAGQTIRAKARQLVTYCHHQDRLLELARLTLREQPQAQVWAT